MAGINAPLAYEKASHRVVRGALDLDIFKIRVKMVFRLFLA